MRFISVDLETTGLDPQHCQILEIGAVIGDLTETPVDCLPTFQCYVKHNEIVGEPFALAMNADILREIANPNRLDVYSPANAMMQFMEFVRFHYGDERPTPAGKNYAGFDKNFLERLPGWDRRAFKHRSLDPAGFYWWPESDTELPDTKTCMERAGLDGSVKHRAVDDARTVVQLIRRGL